MRTTITRSTITRSTIALATIALATMLVACSQGPGEVHAPPSSSAAHASAVASSSAASETSKPDDGPNVALLTDASNLTIDDDSDEMRVTDTGLGIEDVKVGTGRAVAEDDRVTVHYVGRLDDGTVFEDSRKKGAPYSFDVGHGKVIAGWDEGVVGMQQGGIRKLTVPAKLAYRDVGQPGKIPPGALLEFVIEIVEIEASP